MTALHDKMDRNDLIALLPEDSLFTRNLHTADRVDSTNTRLKELAEQGACEGTVLLAEEQTAGRGTQGRAFFSARGEGLYLSLLLRPTADLEQLLTLTGRMAVAVQEGIRAACGAPVSIKWLNDIYLNGRKVCGILTELAPNLTDFAVVGIGVNVSQSEGTFRAEGLADIATSLAAEGYLISRHVLAASILRSVEDMYRAFPGGLDDCVARYRANCLTVGRPIAFQADGRTLTGVAAGIDRDFSLLAETAERRLHKISSGTVTLL